MNSSNISVLIYNANEPLPKQGGMERITDCLARELSAHGIKTILLCSKFNRLGEIYNAPVPIYYLPEKGKKEFFLDLITRNQVTHIIDQNLSGIIGKYGIFKKRVNQLTNRTLIAVQHNSAKTVLRHFKIAMGRNYNNRTLQLIYNFVILPAKKYHSIYLNKKLFREQCDNYDKIVLLSKAYIDEFIWFDKRADNNKLLAIPNMTSFDEVNHSDKENRLLFVGRLVSSTKGCDKLLRIWKHISEEIDNWHLDIVGDGPDRPTLERYATKLGLKNYTFYGYRDPKSFYEKAKIFSMCSTYEGFPLVLTEAMQHGVIPIAFNSFSSVQDIISNGENGLLISPFDENSYATKLKELMRNTDKQKYFSKNAINSVVKYSKGNVIRQWVNLLETTLKR